MRKFILLLPFVAFAVSSATAQDTIVFKNYDSVLAKVTEVTPNSVSYKRWDNIDGPVYTINRTDIACINYQNGQKDVFNDIAQTDTAAPALNTTAPTRPFQNIRFQSYLYAGVAFFKQAVGPTFDASVGARLREYAYIGIETGFHTIFYNRRISYKNQYGNIRYRSYTATLGYVPIGINLKGYVPVGKKIYPYINCSFGSFIGLFEINKVNGFYSQVGAGIDIKRFSLGIGYSVIMNGGNFNCGYAKFGIRLGKW